MSTKRILVIAIVGVVLIASALGVMLLASYLGRDSEAVRLPDTPVAGEGPVEATPDELDRVEVTGDTVQAVVSMLRRPETYSRELVIESLWDGGQAVYDISVSVSGGVTSLRSVQQHSAEKRIIVTPDTLYIWYAGESIPFAGDAGAVGDARRTADEWQMLVTYEDILGLNRDEIVDAGYTEYDGEDCVFAVYSSPLLGHTRTYYVSADLGLVIAAKEYDSAGTLIYQMAAGECLVGQADPAAFRLPDGTDLMKK